MYHIRRKSNIHFLGHEYKCYVSSFIELDHHFKSRSLYFFCLISVSFGVADYDRDGSVTFCLTISRLFRHNKIILSLYQCWWTILLLLFMQAEIHSGTHPCKSQNIWTQAFWHLNPLLEINFINFYRCTCFSLLFAIRFNYYLSAFSSQTFGPW